MQKQTRALFRLYPLWLSLMGWLVACGGSTPQINPKTALVAPAQSADAWPQRPSVKALETAGFPSPTRLRIDGPSGKTGMNVLVVERHHSSAVFLKWVMPGGRTLSIGRDGRFRWPEGTVDIMADMLTEGSKRHRGGKLAAALEDHGAELSFHAIPDGFVVSGRVLSGDLGAWFSLAHEAMLSPTFEARPLANLLKRRRARLRTLATRPRAVAGRVFNRLIYGDGHPYGSPGATFESVQRIKARHLRAARAALVQLSGSTLVVVGDVQPAQLATQLRALFANALGKATPPTPAWRPPTSARPGCHVVDTPKAVQTVIMHGNLSPRRGEVSWPKLLLVNQVLGGSASSRLFAELRERRGLTYGVYSSFDGRRFAGDWSVTTSVRTDKAVEALGALRQELSRMQLQPPSRQEMTSARRFLTGQFVMAQTSGAAVARRLAQLRLYDRPADYWQRWVQQLHAVRAAEMPALAKRWMGSSGAITLLVGNIAKMRPALDIACPTLIVHDEHGRVVRHALDEDAQMTDADRRQLFAAWATSKASRPALTRFLANTKRRPAYRAQALYALISGPQDADGPQLGAVATDWPKVAKALIPLLISDLSTPAGVNPTDRARAARRWLLDVAAPVAGGSVLDATAKTLGLTAVSTWAFAGVAADDPTAVIQKLVPQRIVAADLPRLGEPGQAGLEALISGNLWRTRSAKALVAQGSAGATARLARGYRRVLVMRRTLPTQSDLDLLVQAPSERVALLLFNVYTLHRLGHSDPRKEPALARMVTALHTVIDTLAARSVAPTGDGMAGQETLLKHAFPALMSHFESLLSSPDPDDRWWAADHLVRYRGVKGLRIILLNLADDRAYAHSPLADHTAAEMFTRFARTGVVPLGAVVVRPLLLAALAGRSRVAKVIAITSLRSMRDASSMNVLRTHRDRTNVGPLIGARERLTVTALARAAAAVRTYVERVDSKERQGALAPPVATAHREAAYLRFTLRGRKLAEDVSRAVETRLQSNH